MGTVNLREFPDRLHDALRVEAAKRMTSIKALLIRAAEAWLRREVGKGTRRGKA